MRKYGNMFRAFDCPNDSVTNRVRTTDVKMLCGSTAVHSDMFTWHKEEPVELAALQLVNILFSVPQLSVQLENMSEEYLKMIEFYTQYWNKNRGILLDGDFLPMSPLANYPILSASVEKKIIYGVYENMVVEIEPGYESIALINGKMNEQIAFEVNEDMGICEVKIYNCLGELDWRAKDEFGEGIHALEVGACGMICIERIAEI